MINKIFKIIEDVCDVIFHIGIVGCALTPILFALIPFLSSQIQNAVIKGCIWCWVITMVALAIASFREVMGLKSNELDADDK